MLQIISSVNFSESFKDQIISSVNFSESFKENLVLFPVVLFF
jgi:hypothetical protein